MSTHSNDLEIPEELSVWLRKFEKKHGRPLRVLHVGNIANNAYLNAKFLRGVGIEADVLSNDYYHMMGCPEWEDANFNGHWKDDFFPDWSAAKITDFSRPEWFIQGPLSFCAETINARYEKKGLKSFLYKQSLNFYLFLSGKSRKWIAVAKYPGQLVRTAIYLFKRMINSGINLCRKLLLKLLRGVFRLSRWILRMLRRVGVFGALRRLGLVGQLRQIKVVGRLMRLYLGFGHKVGVLKNNPNEYPIVNTSVTRKSHFFDLLYDISEKPDDADMSLDVSEGETSCDCCDNLKCDQSVKTETVKTNTDFASGLVKEFSTLFPQRPDKLTLDDLGPYLSSSPLWRKIFKHYDIVQCYATHPIQPMLAGLKNYVAFEHGTLRDFTMGDSPEHRLTSMSYRKSSHSFITNGDCLEFAQKLKIPNFGPMIHPIDVEVHEKEYSDDVRKIREKYDADVLLFCPIRHDWKVKGTDIHLRALPQIVERLGKKVVLIVTHWGGDLEASKSLIKELGVEENVVWDEPMHRQKMIHHLKAADVVLDQMALPHFGSTAPQSLAAGVPVIMSYIPESTKWIIAEPAPILAAFTPEEVSECVVQALNSKWLENYKLEAKQWIHKHHHPDRIILDHLRVYKKIMEGEL